jgi:hypothetical protein
MHEIKHDGFRILARRDSAGVRLITRAGNSRLVFPLSQWLSASSRFARA